MTTASFIDDPQRGTHHGGFAVNVHGPVAARLFDLIYSYADVRIVDVDGAGAFLAPESALDLADRIADDEQLQTLIVQSLGGPVIGEDDRLAEIKAVLGDEQRHWELCGYDVQWLVTEVERLRALILADLGGDAA